MTGVKNLPQRVIATIYGVSQPTISRAINAVLDLLERFLPAAPTVDDLVPTRHRVLDGTLVPCWSWKRHRQLISGKRKATGHNLAVLTDQSGNTYVHQPANA
ncbi:transposase family protein [Corynebacterium canis]|uniref:Transposase family protein n=1 Tax=Corynebacterium canis TaxID=679663 RepID=A0A5C5TUA1_9CORY|nr:transposase family protein [Corynebacterium canis]TWT17089.1 transposase family protein [Corynebacterium canis]